MTVPWSAWTVEHLLVAGGALVLLVLLVLVYRSRVRARSADGGGGEAEGEGVLLVPAAPPEDAEVVSSASVLGLEPEPKRGRAWKALGVLVLLIAAGFAGHALFLTSSSEAGPAGGQVPARSAPPADEPLRQPVEVSTPERAVEEAPEEDVAVDEERGLRMISWSGGGQEGEPDRPLRRALSVVIRDSLDRPVEGMPVRFRVATGGGQLDPERVSTNDLGLAASVWHLGEVEDSLRVEVQAPGVPALRLSYTASFTEEARQALAEAAAEEERTAGATAGGATRSAPRTLAALRPRASLAAGGVHTCRLDAADEVTCWGGREGGDPALGATPGESAFRTIVAGIFHSCGLTSQGVIRCWQARPGAGPSLAAPAEAIPLPGNEIPVDVVAGSEHSCALASSGSVYCWGRNTHGQLGDGSTQDSREPVRVRDLPPVAQLSTGWLHTCALARDGRPYCWGANASGQLGDGSTTDRERPRQVATDARFRVLTAGSAHTCAITTGGTALCWGANARGQLGTGDTSSSSRPAPVEADLTFRTLAAGGTHTCGLTSGGEAWCWGGNPFGQLGTGSWTDSRSPARVAGEHEFLALEAGGAHTCGLVGDQVYCWGNNIQGQLGDGTRENRSRPTPRTVR